MTDHAPTTTPDAQHAVSGVVAQYAAVLAIAPLPPRDPAAVAAILHAALALIAVEALPPSPWRTTLGDQLAQRGWWDRPGARLARALGITRMAEIDAILADLRQRLGADSADAAASAIMVAAALANDAPSADAVQRALRCIGVSAP